MKQTGRSESLAAARNMVPSVTYNPVHEPHTRIQKEENLRTSAATTTITQLMDLARRSPRKPDSHPSSMASRHGSTASQHASTTRSRHSNRSGPGEAAARPRQVGGTDDEGKTSRAHIESNAEKRFFKMMGQPLEADEKPGAEVAVFDRTREGRDDTDNRDEPTKSPKKKLFGMSLPGFRSSNGSSTNVLSSTPVHDIPSKAAQLLGTSSPAKRVHLGRTIRQPFRSETSKSLPSKVYDQQHSHSRRPNHRGSPRANRRIPSSKLYSPEKYTFEKNETTFMPGNSGTIFPNCGYPPTPPAKDTPPAMREQPGQAQAKLNRETESATERNQFTSREKALKIPNFFDPAPVVPTHGGDSPTKFCPYTAEEYAQLIRGNSIASARAHFGSSDDIYELDGDQGPARAEVDVNTFPEHALRWNEDNQKRLAGKGSEQELEPRFYSPSNFSSRLFEGSSPSKNTDERRLLFTVPVAKPNHSTNSTQSDPSNGSIQMIFQGEVSEIDPSSHPTDMSHPASQQKPTTESEGAKSTQEPHPHDRASRPNHNPPYLQQPEQSSSRLTDMLNGVSPSKVGYNGEFFANCPSALPSPLHQAQAPQAPHPAMVSAAMSNAGSLPGTLSDGSNILTHFFMCNEHMDVVGRTIFDLVANQGNAQFAQINEKHKELVNSLTERFEDVKSDLGLIKQQANDAADNNKAIDARLDKLLEYIKAEIAEPLAVQTRKNTEMEKDIEILKKGMQELKVSVQTPPSSQSQPTQGSQTGFPPALPNQRSQPSLAGYYEPNGDASRETPRLPAIQEVRNNGQYRYGNGNYGQGQTWYRPPTSGAENKDRPYPLSNPYNNGPGQYGAGSSGGFYAGIPGYYAGHANEYNSGGTK